MHHIVFICNKCNINRLFVEECLLVVGERCCSHVPVELNYDLFSIWTAARSNGFVELHILFHFTSLINTQYQLIYFTIRIYLGNDHWHMSILCSQILILFKWSIRVWVHNYHKLTYRNKELPTVCYLSHYWYIIN